MLELYSRISELCSRKGIKVGKMCNDLGISRGILTDLKMERKQTLSAANLSKIASYLGTSVNYLLDGEVNDQITDDQLMVGLLDGDVDGFTAEMLNEVKRYAKYVRDKGTSKNS